MIPSIYSFGIGDAIGLYQRPVGIGQSLLRICYEKSCISVSLKLRGSLIILLFADQLFNEKRVLRNLRFIEKDARVHFV